MLESSYPNPVVSQESVESTPAIRSTEPVLGLFAPPKSSSAAAVPSVELPIPASVVEAFAAATGWLIGFEESSASFRKRAENGSHRPTAGVLKIVDMSDAWPAKKPTAHRGHCDQFVSELNKLVSFTDATNTGQVRN
jgi:hypothetical protein